MHVSIKEAGDLLLKGEVVAVPTETVYGLAASLYQPQAIDKVFFLKKRPSNNPLIIHVASTKDLLSFVDTFPSQFNDLASAFWPGPLTIVLPINPDKIAPQVRGGLTTAAFRIPSNPIALELLAMTGPLVMPSANVSSTPSATCIEHVEKDFGKKFPAIDGGECVSGVESTIIMFDVGRWKILRLGALAPEIFESVLGYQPEVSHAVKGQTPLCPGQLYRHYAPHAKLILEMPYTTQKAVVIGFDDRHYPPNCRLIVLGSSKNPEEAAHNLYAVLRRIDEEGINQAFVDMDFPDSGLWRTLKERLIKASAT